MGTKGWGTDILATLVHGVKSVEAKVGLIAQRASIAFTSHGAVDARRVVANGSDVSARAAGSSHRSALLSANSVWCCLPTIFPILSSAIIKRYL